MISRCMREDIEFGIVLSREPTDAKMFETFQIGTLAKIIDWQQGNDGLLGITTLGTQKFKIITVNISSFSFAASMHKTIKLRLIYK